MAIRAHRQDPDHKIHSVDSPRIADQVTTGLTQGAAGRPAADELLSGTEVLLEYPMYYVARYSRTCPKMSLPASGDLAFRNPPAAAA